MPVWLLLSIIPGICCKAQSTNPSICGIKLFPLSVSSYSTRGGTSAYTLRLTSPSVSSVRRVTVSMRCEISAIVLWISQNRMVPLAFNVIRTSIDHLSPSLHNTFRTGQLSSGWKFFIFLTFPISLSFNNGYLYVSSLSTGAFLFFGRRILTFVSQK